MNPNIAVKEFLLVFFKLLLLDEDEEADDVEDAMEVEDMVKDEFERLD